MNSQLLQGKIWRFPEIGVPVLIHLNGMFHYKPTSWGYLHFPSISTIFVIPHMCALFFHVSHIVVQPFPRVCITERSRPGAVSFDVSTEASELAPEFLKSAFHTADRNHTGGGQRCLRWMGAKIFRKKINHRFVLWVKKGQKI